MLLDWHELLGSLSDEEAEKVASFSADLTLSSSREEARALVKTAMNTLTETEEGVDRLIGTLNFLRKHGSYEERSGATGLLELLSEVTDEAVKTAAEVFPADEKYQSAGEAKDPLHYMSLAAAAAPFLMQSISAQKRRKAVGGSINDILSEHPELRDDPHAGKYFDVIHSFAPDVAANPMLAGNVMKSLHQVGPGAMTPKVVKELIDFQEAHQKNQGVPAEALRNFATIAGGLARKS